MPIVFLLGMVLAVVGALRLRRHVGFAAQTPDDYRIDHHDFDLRRHLDGAMICEGVIFGPMGRVTSRFVADVDCAWDGDSGVMREAFRYDSGATQDREWRLTLGEDGAIAAEADDVIGTGAGRQAGSAVLLRYRIRLPEDAGGHTLDAIDWMYLVGNGTIMNRSQFRKFGIKVAEIVATLRRRTV